MKEKQLTKKVTFDVYIKELDVWAPQTFTARIFELEPGRFIRLFPIGTLARVLCRTPQMVTFWERDGKFPAPLFAIDGDKRKTRRWYSEAQILMVSKHQRNILGDKPTSTNNQHSDHDQFFAAVRRDWTIELREETV